MTKSCVAAMLVAMFASLALAEDGLPTAGKLNSLGLSSMQVASDHDGMQVRGKAFAKLIYTWNASAGEKAQLDPVVGGVVTPGLFVDPANYLAHDRNNGAGITEDGLPLVFGNVFMPQVGAVQADADHEQIILDSAGNIAFTEISSSRNGFTTQLGMFQVNPPTF